MLTCRLLVSFRRSRDVGVVAFSAKQIRRVRRPSPGGAVAERVAMLHLFKAQCKATVRIRLKYSKIDHVKVWKQDVLLGAVAHFHRGKRPSQF